MASHRIVLLLLTILVPLGWLSHLAVVGAEVFRSSEPASATRATEPGDEEAEFRLREGIELTDEIGEFQLAGERVRFRPRDQNLKLTVLENLALERVSRVLDETRTPPTWAVSGRVTEYHGTNFLLITRAVVKSK